MAHPDYEAAKHFALQLLADGLPDTAHYHSLQHTRDDVLPATERLATGEDVDGEQRVCLLTAACFHDVGHIEDSRNHEEISVRIASRVLPRYGYLTAQIALISRLILATRVPQTPVTLLEKIMVDADMDSLGREDFLTTSLALRQELAAAGKQFTDRAWYEQQLTFLHAHRYFTHTARVLRGPGKRRNIERLQDLIARDKRVPE